ncbi:unnamed protein product [Ectocarpus sp. CCAP 1310/34]|nr:unnamed protein product [Ectocarpus sp. CCAP 1310/34]
MDAGPTPVPTVRAGNGAEPKTLMREEISTPQPESTAKAETDSSASDAGRGRDRWWGGRVSSNVAPASEESVGERSSAEPDDRRVTGEQDSQIDLAAGAAETDGAHSSSIGGGVNSIPWLKPAKGAPADGSTATRKDYTRGGKPKWRKGSGRGDVDGSEAKKAEERGGDSASSVTVEPQGAGGLVVPSASEEPVPEAEAATVVVLPAMVDDVAAIDEEVMSPGEQTVEQGETEAAGVPDVDDDTPVETAVAVETESEDSDSRLPATDAAGATDSSSEQFGSSPGDRAKEAAAREDIAGGCSDGGEATGGSGISTSADACTEPMSLESADARADPSADGAGVEEGDVDGKAALAKEKSINDDILMAGKDTSDGSVSGGGDSGSGSSSRSPEATTEEVGEDLESSVTADTQVSVPTAENVPATMDAAAAVDVEVAPAGENTVGQGETEAAGEVSTDGVGDVSGAAAEVEIIVAVDKDAGGQSLTGPNADLEDLMASSSGTADVAARDSSVDGSPDDSAAPGVDDKSPAEASVAVNTEGEDTDHTLTATDQADVKIGFSSEQFANDATADRGVTESAIDGEQTTDSGGISKTAGAGGKSPSLETADARAKPGADDTGDNDGKSALAKEEEIIQDDVGVADKAARDTGGFGSGGGSSSGKRTESKTDKQGDVSTPQPASMPKAETDSSSSGARRSSEDGLMDGSGAPGAADDSLAEAVVAEDSPGEDSDDALTAGDEANVEVGSSWEQLTSSPRNTAKEAIAAVGVAESSSDKEEGTGSGMMSTASGAGVETTLLDPANARSHHMNDKAKPDSDDIDGEEGNDDKSALVKEESIIKGDAYAAEEATSGGDDSGSHNGTKPKTDMRGEVAIPQPESTAKAATGTSASDAGSGGGRWRGGRVSDTVAPVPEVSVGARASAEPDDGRATEEQDSQVDSAESVAEIAGADSSSVRGDVDSFPWLQPGKGAPGDGSRTSRKVYARGGKPKWRYGSGRGDVGGFEAKKLESGAGSESSVTAGTQGAEGLVVPSASEEPPPKMETATVAVDGTAAVDEAVAFPGEERTVGKGEREAAGVSLMGGAVDISGVGGLGVGGAVSVDASSDGVTPANPGAKLGDDEGSSSATADGAAGDSALDGLMSGSGAPGAADDSLAEAVGTVESPGKDSDDYLTAGDEANVEVVCSSEQLPSNPGDTPNEAIVRDRVAEISSDKEAPGSGTMSVASGAGTETTSLEPEDSRAKPSANDTDSEEGDDDRKGAPAKEEEDITDDVDPADKVTSDTSGGYDSGGDKGAGSIADPQGNVSAPQLEWTTKTETDSSASEAGRGRRPLWRGSEVDVGEGASSEPYGGLPGEEQDGQVDLAQGVTEADEANSSSVRDGVDSVPWWKAAKSALGDGWRASRKDLSRSGKPRGRKGSGRGDVGVSAPTNVGSSEGKKTEERGGNFESSVTADTQGAEELVVLSASEEQLPKVEKDTAVDGTAAVNEAVASPEEERTGEQVATEAAGVSLVGGAADMSGLSGLGDGGTISVGRSSDGVTTAGPCPSLPNDQVSSSSITDGAGGESSVDETMSGSGAPGAGDNGQAGAVVAEGSPGEDVLTAGDEANVEVGSSSEQLPSSPRDTAKEGTAEDGVAESSSDKEDSTSSGLISTASGAGVETTSLEATDARAKPTADDTDGEEGDDYGKSSEESIQDNVNAADKPTSGNSGGGDSGSDNGAAESKAGTRGEVSTPQPESMAKAATDTSTSDAGRGGGRWWGGRVSNAVAPASEVSAAELSTAELDDGRATVEKDSQVDPAAGAAETDGADSSSVRDGVDSFPWGKPVKSAPDDRSRASRKQYARSSKWRKGSGRGDVGDSEAMNTEKSGSGFESFVTADRQETKGLAVPSVSEEPAPKMEKATVEVNDIAAVDETMASPREERPGGQAETEAAGVSLMGGSGVGGLSDVGSASVDGTSDGVTTAGPEADVKDDEGSSSLTADGAAGESSVDGLMTGSGAPGAADDSLAEAAVAQDSPGEDSDDALTAGDEANVEVGSSSEQLASSSRDTAKGGTAEERVVGSSSDREEASGGGMMSTALGAGVETTLLDPADARAKLTADDTNGEEGDDDGKGAPESIQDDVDAADKPTSDGSGGGSSGSEVVAAESKNYTRGEVSTPQPESTTKAETDTSASDAGRGRDRWLGGRVSNAVGPASEVIDLERSSAKPDDDDGRATVEEDSQVDPAEAVAQTDGADSSSVRSDVDSFPWLKPAKGAPGDISRAARKDLARSGKPKWLRGSGRVNVDGSEGTGAEESYGGLENSVAPDTRRAEGLVVPSASEEPAPKVEQPTVAAAAVDEAVASTGEERTVGQDDSKTGEGFVKDGVVDVSGAAGLGDVSAVSVDGRSDRVTTAGPEADLEDDGASSSAVADVGTGDSPIDRLVDVSRASGAGDDRPSENAVAVDSPGQDSNDALTAADKPDGKIGSSSGQVSSGPGERAKEATAGDGVTTSLEPADARAKPSADETDGKEGDENGKRAVTKEEEGVQDDIGTADKPTSDTSGGDDSGSGKVADPKMDMGGQVSTPQPEAKPTTDTSGGDSGSGNAAEPKTDMGGEVSTPQPESTAKAETDASTSGTGRGRGRWWGGRVLNTVAPASEVGVGERTLAKPKDDPSTEEQDSQLDPAEPVAEADEADSSSVRGDVELVPRWTPAEDTRGDVSRTSRKDYTRSGKPKWKKSSGRGDVDGSEAKKTEESDGDLESSITADTQGTEELVVPSASEEPLPTASVVVDDTGAVDEEVSSAEEETALGQDETETAEGSLMHGVVDVLGVGAVGVGGAVSADTNSDGVTKADPHADLEDDEESSSATDDGAVWHSPEGGLIDDSGAPRGDDDRSAEGVAAADTSGGDTRDGLRASDQTDAGVASSSEQLVTSTRDTAEADAAEEGVTESALGGEPACGSEDFSTAVDSRAQITSPETADARATPRTDDTDGEDGGDDGKGSLAKEEESIQDDVDTADKVISDASDAVVGGSKNGAEPKAGMLGEVSTPQPESTAKAEADGGRGRWWGGRVPDTVVQASDVGVGERSPVEPDDGRATEEQDSQVTSAETVAEADGADLNSLRRGVDSAHRWKPANGTPGDDSKASPKDYTRSGKPKWRKGSGRGDVDGSETKKAEESGGDSEILVTADIQGAEELVVPTASEEPIPMVDENAGDDASPTLSATAPMLSGVAAGADDSTLRRATVVDTNPDSASTAADSPESDISPASQPQWLTRSPGTKSEEPADSGNVSQGSCGTPTTGDASTAAGEGKGEDDCAKEAIEDRTSVGEGGVVLERAAAAAETASVGSSEGGVTDVAIKGADISVGPSAGDFPRGTAGSESGSVVTGAADGAANGVAIVSDVDAKRARDKAKLGVVKLQQGEAEKAISLFEQAASIDPGWWEVFYYAALAHETLGNTAAAAHALVSALGIPAHTEDVEVAKLATLASQVLAALEDDEQHGSTAEILKTAMDSSGLMFAGTSFVRGEGRAGAGPPGEPRNERSLSGGDAPDGGAVLEEEKKVDLCDKIWEVIREVTAPLDASAAVDAPSVDDAGAAELAEDEGRDATEVRATSVGVDPDADGSAVADEEGGGGAEDALSQPRRSTRTWAKGSGWAKGMGWTKEARGVGGARDSRT